MARVDVLWTTEVELQNSCLMKNSAVLTTTMHISKLANYLFGFEVEKFKMNH